MAISSFRQLDVWQKSFTLAEAVYRYCEALTSDEKFGLVSQIRRAAVSIPSNIAEGQQRNSRKEYRQFIGIAQGSAAELETQLLLAHNLYGHETSELLKELEIIQKMLYSLGKRLSPHQKPITNNP